MNLESVNWTFHYQRSTQNTKHRTHLLGAKAEAEATRAATIRVCLIMVMLYM
jgi:hypothetical protein